MPGLLTIDDQLADLIDRRTRCRAQLRRCIDELEAMPAKFNALLDWKLDGDGGPLIEPDQMT